MRGHVTIREEECSMNGKCFSNNISYTTTPLHATKITNLEHTKEFAKKKKHLNYDMQTIKNHLTSKITERTLKFPSNFGSKGQELNPEHQMEHLWKIRIL